MRSADLERSARWLLALATLASGLLLFHLTRGSSFWGDDWVWVTTRRTTTIHNLLAPYDGHLSVVPVAVYQVMFRVFGAGSYGPYRVLVIGLSLIVGLLVYAWSSPRVGRFPAMLVATLVLFDGPAWQDTMWAFQIGWVLALGFGIAALLMLERRTRRADIAACVLTFASIGSTSFGIAFAIGIAVDVAVSRRRWRDAWIPGIPLGLYALWALHYHPTGIKLSEITLVPGNVVQTFAGGAAGIVGLTNATALDPVANTLTFGAPLVVLLALASVRAITRRQFTGRAAALIVVLVVFSTLTTLGRAFETPLVSRYIYPDCVLVALFVVELARGRRATGVTQAGLAVLALLAIIANVGVLRSGGQYLRAVGASTNADIAALDLGRGRIPSGYVATQLPDYPFVSITAGSYYAARDAMGSPADSIAGLVHAPSGAQAAADGELIGEQSIVLSSGTSPASPAGAPPPVITNAAGASGQRGSCTLFRPSQALPAGATSSVTLRMPPGALRITAGDSPVAVAAARFGPTTIALGTVGPGRSAIVLFRHDAAPQFWRLTLQTGAPATACTLG